MRQGLANKRGPPGGEPQLERCVPDRDIIGTALPAGVEPPLGVVVMARANRQVCSPEPDAIVVGSQPGGLLEIDANLIDGVGLEGELDVHAKLIDGAFRRSLAGLVEVCPPFLEQAAGLGEPADLAEDRDEQHTGVRGVVARVESRFVDQLLGVGEPSLVMQEAHPGENGLVRQLRPGQHPGQGLRGRLEAAPLRFTPAEQDRRLTRVGRALEEFVQFASGDREPAVGHLELDRHDRAAIVLVRPPGPASPEHRQAANGART